MEALSERLTTAMKNEFGADEKRINHALSVFAHAQELSEGEAVDHTVVAAAALLHDIGIQAAERRHGSSAGRYQELEGPPLARRIMEALGLEEAVIEHVCKIVASHHSGGLIDTTEFRLLWDADWLVNIPEVFAGCEKEKLQDSIDKIFKTGGGKKKAYRMFLGKQ